MIRELGGEQLKNEENEEQTQRVMKTTVLNRILSTMERVTDALCDWERLGAIGNEVQV